MPIAHDVATLLATLKKTFRGGSADRALVRAVGAGDTEGVQALLANGADVKANTTRGETALMLAVVNGHTEIVQALLANGADVKAEHKDGETALLITALISYTDLVQLLKTRKAITEGLEAPGHLVADVIEMYTLHYIVDHGGEHPSKKRVLSWMQKLKMLREIQVLKLAGDMTALKKFLQSGTETQTEMVPEREVPREVRLAELQRCAACGKRIPADEMTSRKGVLDSMGTDSDEDSPLANVARAMGAATQAWKCDTCGDWICNSCVCRTSISGGGGQIQHSNCGGMFRSPR